MFLPQAPGRFWPLGRWWREAGAWVVAIVEWPREKYWGLDNSHGFQ